MESVLLNTQETDLRGQSLFLHFISLFFSSFDSFSLSPFIPPKTKISVQEKITLQLQVTDFLKKTQIKTFTQKEITM